MDLLHAVWDDTTARVHPLIPALLDDCLRVWDRLLFFATCRRPHWLRCVMPGGAAHASSRWRVPASSAGLLDHWALRFRTGLIPAIASNGDLALIAEALCQCIATILHREVCGRIERAMQLLRSIIFWHGHLRIGVLWYSTVVFEALETLCKNRLLVRWLRLNKMMTYLDRFGSRTRSDSHLRLRCRLLIEIADMLRLLWLVPHRASLLRRQLLDSCDGGEREWVGRVQSARDAVDWVLFGELGGRRIGGRFKTTHLILLLGVSLAV